MLLHARKTASLLTVTLLCASCATPVVNGCPKLPKPPASVMAPPEPNSVERMERFLEGTLPIVPGKPKL